MTVLGSGLPTSSLVKLALSKAKVAFETCERYERISSILSNLRTNPDDKKYESIPLQMSNLFDRNDEKIIKNNVIPLSMSDLNKLINSEPLNYQPKLLKVVGWCKSIRKQNAGKLLFVILNDGSCKANLQIVVHEGADGHNIASKCTSGSSIKATGIIVARDDVNANVNVDSSYESLESVSNKFELHVSSLDGHSIEVLGHNVNPAKYPIAKKFITNEFLREVAHLRARSYLISAVMRIRNALAFATHLYFQKLGCIYFNSPIITTADCEGAGELFQVTTLLDGTKTLAELSTKMGHGTFKEKSSLVFKKDFFKKPAYLTCSGQLSLEAYACSMGSGYTFGPTFRAENSHTNRHLAEFWMIEPELSFTDLYGNMEIAEEYIKFVINYVLDHCMDDMIYFDNNIENGLIQRLKNVVNSKFERITYNDVIDILLQHEEDFKNGLVKPILNDNNNNTSKDSTHEVQSKSSSPEESSSTKVQSLSSPLSVPPEVGLADSSSDYLSLKGNATPGDRGEESETIHGSRGEVNREATTASEKKSSTRPRVEPVADLREAKGEVNKEAVCKTNVGPQVEDKVVTSSGGAFEYGVYWGMDLQSEHERFISEVIFKKPVIIYNYPCKIKAFYMRKNDDGKTCAAMDVIVPKIGELVGGSQREERLDILLQSIKDNNLNEKDYWWYIDLRNYGTIPHSGFGLGFERLIMMVTGIQNIKDVIPFPRSPGNAEF